MPSPKLQFQAVGVFVELSVNSTVKGATPEVWFAEKSATGEIGRLQVSHVQFSVHPGYSFVLNVRFAHVVLTLLELSKVCVENVCVPIMAEYAL